MDSRNTNMIKSFDFFDGANSPAVSSPAVEGLMKLMLMAASPIPNAVNKVFTPKMQVFTPVSKVFTPVPKVNLKKQATFETTCHLKEQSNSKNAFLPLCCNAKTEKLLTQNPGLLAEHITEALKFQDNVVIFIANGRGMTYSAMSMGLSKGKATRAVNKISEFLHRVVPTALDSLPTELRNRVQFTEWSSMIDTKEYNEKYELLHEFLHSNPEHQKIITECVKTLFEARSNKIGATGQRKPRMFMEEGFGFKNSLKVIDSKKYSKRYGHLERSITLEMIALLAGINCNGMEFPTQRYLTTNPFGMTTISKCVEATRRAILESKSCNIKLKNMTKVSHAIFFVQPVNL